MESYIGHGSFFIGPFRPVLHQHSICRRHNFVGRAYSTMSIILTLLAAFIWCGITYAVLRFFGYVTRDDKEDEE